MLNEYKHLSNKKISINDFITLPRQGSIANDIYNNFTNYLGQ